MRCPLLASAPCSSDDGRSGLDAATVARDDTGRAVRERVLVVGDGEGRAVPAEPSSVNLYPVAMAGRKVKTARFLFTNYLVEQFGSFSGRLCKSLPETNKHVWRKE